MKITRKNNCSWWHMSNSFVSTCVIAFHTTHVQNKTLRFHTEGIMPGDSFCGVVSSPFWFTKCFICRTGFILSVNAKCIYLSETRVFTIIKACCITYQWRFFHCLHTFLFEPILFVLMWRHVHLQLRYIYMFPPTSLV